jgi:hypothetical protein
VQGLAHCVAVTGLLQDQQRLLVAGKGLGIPAEPPVRDPEQVQRSRLAARITVRPGGLDR